VRLVTLVFLLLAFVSSAQARPGVVLGVNDSLFALDSSRAYELADALGISQTMTTVIWWPRKPSGGELDGIPPWRSIAVAVTGYAEHTPNLPWWRDAYCDYVRSLVLRYPNIRAVQIWNEPWPLDGWSWGGTGQQYIELLARCYDRLPKRVVVLAPGSHPDVVHQLEFVANVQEYYRETRRRKPLFDAYSVHPYWSLDQAGVKGRPAKAMNKWWRGLPQRSPKRGLRFWWTETGVESTVYGISADYTDHQVQWRGLRSPEQQAARITEVVRSARRDPLVVASFNFLLVDERSLVRWQSGLYYRNGEPKPAFYAYQRAIRP
jgi:hypothetical protein